MAFAFVQAKNPKVEDYQKLMSALIANRKGPDDKEVLKPDEKRKLIEMSTWYFFDKTLVDADISLYEEIIGQVFEKLKSKNLLPNLEEYKVNELEMLKPGIKRNVIDKLNNKV